MAIVRQHGNLVGAFSELGRMVGTAQRKRREGAEMYDLAAKIYAARKEQETRKMQMDFQMERARQEHLWDLQKFELDKRADWQRQEQRRQFYFEQTMREEQEKIAKLKAIDDSDFLTPETKKAAKLAVMTGLPMYQLGVTGTDAGGLSSEEIMRQATGGGTSPISEGTAEPTSSYVVSNPDTGQVLSSSTNLENLPSQKLEAIRKVERESKAGVYGIPYTVEVTKYYPTTQEEYNLIPVGSQYVDPANGKIYRKQ